MCSCVKISTPPFHIDLSGKRFYVCVTKSLLFLSADHVFRIVQKSQNPNYQFHFGHRDNNKRETFLGKFLVTLSECSMFFFTHGSHLPLSSSLCNLAVTK